MAIIAVDTIAADQVTASAKATTSLVTGAITLVLGQLVAVAIDVLLSKGNTTISSVTDGLGNSYSLAQAISNGATVRSELWTALVKTSGSTTITITSGASTNLAVAVVQYSGGTVNTGKTSTNTGTGTSATTAAITTGAGGAWIIGAVATGAGTATLSASAPTNQRKSLTTSGGSASTNCGVAEADSGNVATIGTSTTLTETISASQAWAFAAVELDPTANLSQPVTFTTVPLRIKQFGQSLTVGFKVTAVKPLSGVSLTQPLIVGFPKSLTATAARSQSVAFGTSRTSFASKTLSSPLTFGFALSTLRTRLFAGIQPLTFGSAPTTARTRLFAGTQPITFANLLIKTGTRAASALLSFAFTVSASKGLVTLVQSLTIGVAVSKMATRPVSQSLVVSSVSTRLATKAFLTSISFGFSIPKSSGKTARQGLTVSFAVTAIKPTFGPLNLAQAISFGFNLPKTAAKSLPPFGVTVGFKISASKPLLQFSLPITTGFSFTTSKSRTISAVISILENALRDIQTLEACLNVYQSGSWSPGGVQITASDRATLEATIASLKTKITSGIGGLA